MELEDARTVAEALAKSKQGLSYYSRSAVVVTFDVSTSHKEDFFPSLQICFAVKSAKEASDSTDNKQMFERVSRSTDIEDLEGPRGPPPAPLYIKVTDCSVFKLVFSSFFYLILVLVLFKTRIPGTTLILSKLTLLKYWERMRGGQIKKYIL